MRCSLSVFELWGSPTHWTPCWRPSHDLLSNNYILRSYTEQSTTYVSQLYHFCTAEWIGWGMQWQIDILQRNTCCMNLKYVHIRTSHYSGPFSGLVSHGVICAWTHTYVRTYCPLSVHVCTHTVSFENNLGSSTTTYPTVHCSSHQLRCGDPLGCTQCTARVMLASESSQGDLGYLNTNTYIHTSITHYAWEISDHMCGTPRNKVNVYTRTRSTSCICTRSRLRYPIYPV